LDLAGSSKDGAERLLVKILDPNREPSSTSPVTVLETKQGLALTGFISNQTANDVMLEEANGVQKVVGRQNIKATRSLNLSGMPEGLGAGLSEQDMADLIAYLVSFSAAD
jgi:putative heme-binding domain-containing protein